FFSSRRRHTRFSRDWSSDVCSSDLFIAVEDRRFRHHFGIDPIGLMRAASVDARRGEFVQGGSTLTQQLAKNLFLTPDRTLRRKRSEERRVGKECRYRWRRHHGKKQR